MELRQLRYFVEVASAGSINGAAERLQIAQSAVSRQITALESELGVLLLRRRREGVALTHSGSLFIEGANAILGQLDVLVSAVRQPADEPVAVRLGMPPSVSPMLLDAVGTSFEAGPVRLQLSLIEGSTFWLQQRLDAGDLACAVLTNGRSSRTVRTVPLWRENLMLLGPIDSPFAGRERCALAELAAVPLALTPAPDGTRIAIEAAFSRLGIRPQVRQEHEAMTLLTAQLETGKVHTILTRTVARHLQARFPVTAVAIEGLAIERIFSVRRGALSQVAANKIANTLIECALAKFGGDEWIEVAQQV
jgi:DNA-binding transcriptional LysR family regulator